MPMKNGGIYIISGAVAPKGAGFTQAALGRVDVDAVKSEVLAAGFVLDGESKVLANPADDHTKANGGHGALGGGSFLRGFGGGLGGFFLLLLLLFEPDFLFERALELVGRPLELRDALALMRQRFLARAASDASQQERHTSTAR